MPAPRLDPYRVTGTPTTTRDGISDGLGRIRGYMGCFLIAERLGDTVARENEG